MTCTVINSFALAAHSYVAPTFQALGTASDPNASSGNGYDYAASASPTVNEPAHAAGDILLCYSYGNKSQAICLQNPVWVSGGNSAWASIDSATAAGGNGRWWWSRAVNSTIYGTTNNGGDGSTPSTARFIITAHRGCAASGSPIAAFAQATRTASTSCPFPTVTTPVDNCQMVFFGTRDNDSTAAAWSAQANAALSSIVEQYDSGIAAGGLSITTAVMATAGAVGSTTSTVTSSDGFAFTLALLPA